MTLEATVSIGWVNTVIDTAQRLGVQPDSLLRMAELPAESLSWPRWPIDFITRLWHAAERGTGDPGFGLKVGAGVRPASMDVVAFAMQSAATLREAIALVQKYQRLISDGGRFQLLPGGRSTWLVYHPRQGRLAFSPHQIEAVLAAVVRFSDWITGCGVRPLRVQFSQGRLGPLTGYRAVFACPVEFEQAFSGLLLANDVLDRPLPQADPRLAVLHERFSAGRLAALERDGAELQNLGRWLSERMGQGVPRRAEAARPWASVSARWLAGWRPGGRPFRAWWTRPGEPWRCRRWRKAGARWRTLPSSWALPRSAPSIARSGAGPACHRPVASAGPGLTVPTQERVTVRIQTMQFSR